MKTLVFTIYFRVSFFLAVVSLCINDACLLAQNYSWVKHYAEPSDLRTINMTAAPSGANYQFVGHKGSVTLAGNTFTGDGCLLVRHNSAGDLSWVLGASEINVQEIKATEQHVYLAGSFIVGDFIAGHTFSASTGSKDGFIMRFTKEGVFDKVILISGQGDDVVRDLDVDKSGMMWITGYGSETIVFGDSATNLPGTKYFMAGFDQSGGLTALSRSDAKEGSRITTNSTSDRIFVAAESDVNMEEVVFSNETHTYTTTYPNNGDVFLVSYDAKGKLIATALHSTTLKKSLSTIETSENQELFVEDFTLGDMNIEKYDKNLNKIWRIDVPGTFPHRSGMAADMTGNVYIASELNGSGDYAVIEKYNSAGSLVWSTFINRPDSKVASGDAFAVGIDTDELGDVYIAGHFNGTSDFYNDKSYQSGGQLDFYAARIDGQSDYSSLVKNSLGSIKVYPTVNTGVFTVEYEKTVEGQLEIRDITGRVVYKTISSSDDLQRLNVSLNEGVYFLELKANGVIASSRIIIQK